MCSVSVTLVLLLFRRGASDGSVPSAWPRNRGILS
ncbi:hypothetical protein GLYMA_06G158750v4 [Glycine max]|nr:hypothetical protein GLYMA_06G158750v4 [Glycine max]KAH1126138.1 hypothetical protein GYH30_015255 [Glycine max]